MSKSQPVGLIPLVFDRTTYTSTGKAVMFTDKDGQPAFSSLITLRVDSGNALVALTPDPTGPFISFAEGAGFDFPVRTNGLYVKGDGADCDMTIVIALDPVSQSR